MQKVKQRKWFALFLSKVFKNTVHKMLLFTISYTIKCRNFIVYEMVDNRILLLLHNNIGC